MNHAELEKLIGDIRILAGMLECARKDEKPEAMVHYLNAIGVTMNKIAENMK